VAGRVIAYTGDTAWTDAITAAAGADLLIAEAYYRDKDIPYHLRLADLQAHRGRLTARRILLTHMSADVLDSQPVPGGRKPLGHCGRHPADAGGDAANAGVEEQNAPAGNGGGTQAAPC
jgi:hypothetical protein